MLNTFEYHVEDDDILQQLDSAFWIVEVVGHPETGNGDGYNIIIYDYMYDHEIYSRIMTVYEESANVKWEI